MYSKETVKSTVDSFIFLSCAFFSIFRRKMMLLEEQQIEHYRILRSLGSGKVYLAKDTRLDRLVAIRVMDADVLSGAHSEPAQEVRRLALAKVEKITRLDHPAIMPVYHYGVEIIDDAAFV